jgi:ABC-2 type transport system ATP-binding protein
MSEEPLFKIKGVSKYFGNKRVLSNISFNIMPGEILGIIGASGTGKTTLLNILVGFITPEKGVLQFRFEHLLSFRNTEVYRDIRQKSIEIKRMVGFAAQKPSFYPDLTVEENLEYFGSLYDLSRDALNSNIEALLSLMELKASRFLLARKLSGGMQRRLDIACALVHDPKVLILDEPTSDLDPILRKHIWELIKVIRSKGTTIILSSHHLTEIENLCDRLAILEDGGFVELNTFAYIKNKYIKHKKVLIQIKSNDYKRLLNRVPSRLITAKEIIDNELILTTPKPKQLIMTLLKRSNTVRDEVLNLSIGNPNLDEVFVSISSAKLKKQTNYDSFAEEEISQLSDISKNIQRRTKKEQKKKKKKEKKSLKNKPITKRQSIFIYK